MMIAKSKMMMMMMMMMMITVMIKIMMSNLEKKTIKEPYARGMLKNSPFKKCFCHLELTFKS